MRTLSCYNNREMEWETLEHIYQEKTNDWYASVIIIAGSLVAVEFLMNSFILITLTIVATIAFILLAARRPNMMHVEVSPGGVRAGNVLYPFGTLDAFTIVEYPHETRLLLESNRHFMPLIVVPVADEVDTEELREYLVEYLPEKDLHESLPHLLLEQLGF